MKFYASVRLDVRKGETLKQGGVMVGNHTKVKVVKNKVAPPFKTAEFDIMFGEGISREGDILDLAVEVKVVIKSGAWFSYNGQKIGQGRENAKKYLRENPEACAEIEQKVREQYGLGVEEEDGQEGAKDDKPAKSPRKKGSASAKNKTEKVKEAGAEELGPEEAGPEGLEDIDLENMGQDIFGEGDPDFMDESLLSPDEDLADAADPS